MTMELMTWSSWSMSGFWATSWWEGTSCSMVPSGHLTESSVRVRAIFAVTVFPTIFFSDLLLLVGVP